MNSFIKGVAFVLCVWNLTASVVYTSMHQYGATGLSLITAFLMYGLIRYIEGRVD